MSVDRHMAARLLWNEANDESLAGAHRIDATLELLRAHQRSDGTAIPPEINVQSIRRLSRKLRGISHTKR